MYTDQSPILAPATAAQAQCVRYLLSQPHGEYSEHDISEMIVPGYFATCADAGVDPILAISQMILETANLSSFWSQRGTPGANLQRNPAGIGVTGAYSTTRPANTIDWAYNTQRQRWECGCGFGSWSDAAIPAHVGRLLCWALGANQGTAKQRLLITYTGLYRSFPDNLRGTAPILRYLGAAYNSTGQGWAVPGTDYGANIAAVANRIIGA